jgi:hypothetical protein
LDNTFNIVRLENTTLLELYEIAREIFGNVTFPEGSFFMFGTASIIPGKIWNVDLRQGLDGVGSTLLWDLARSAQDL